ncbi:MAG: PEP-CTERM sorting domain-containing protein [Gammaproteobacteria bacterium]
MIDFTGGTATFAGGGGSGTTTAGSELFNNVDFYVENGFKLDFINASPNNGEHIGDYYGPDGTGNSNDVIHGHWAPNFGDMSAIEISKVGGGTFDLNYFILTSNTAIGGGPATGNEQTYIQAWMGGVMTYQQLLPPESWGWVGVHNPGPLQNDPQIYLGSEFDNVDLVRFVVGNDVFCFGMDEFYIDEAAPPPRGVPEPAGLALVGLGLVGAVRRRKSRG